MATLREVERTLARLHTDARVRGMTELESAYGWSLLRVYDRMIVENIQALLRKES